MPVVKDHDDFQARALGGEVIMLLSFCVQVVIIRTSLSKYLYVCFFMISQAENPFCERNGKLDLMKTEPWGEKKKRKRKKRKRKRKRITYKYNMKSVSFFFFFFFSLPWGGKGF